MAQHSSLDPQRTFLQLTPRGEAERLDAAAPDFWQSLAEHDLDGRLFGVVSTDQDSHWEMHPGGDEILVALSGSIEIVLDLDDETETLTLETGQMCIVPRGVWHRLIVHEPGKLLFATPGPTTHHRSPAEHTKLRSLDPEISA